jgi:serine-type D-Ala-D-Ala carboxypeptidase (penicillin-binding protein 5/6)
LRKIGWALVVLVVVVIALGIVQIVRSPPGQSTDVSAPRPVAVTGSNALPWPASGEAAVAVGTTGQARTSGSTSPVPIASLAKMMTAYVVLKDHPLNGTTTGPSITVTSAEAAAYAAEAAQQDSVLQVTAGETLTEKQALEALLIASADNIAGLLAQWDAGSSAAFVDKMNTTAHALGMDHTTYTDPSGLATSTVSTAGDQLIVNRTAMAIPAFASIVAMPAATFPIGGTVQNYDYDVGHDGVIGVKTGSDSAALGCWAFAATRQVAGTTQTVYGVVLGIPADATGLVEPALTAGKALADAVPGTVRTMTVVPAGTTVGYVTAPWRQDPVPVVTTTAVHGTVENGTRIVAHVVLRPPAGRTVSAGQSVGTLTAAGVDGVDHTTLATKAAGAGPTVMWRLTRL